MPNHIYVSHVGPQGDTMMIPSAHLDLARLITEGDGMGWVGDERLSLNWDPRAKAYCIVRLCEDNVRRPVTWVKPEEFDQRVLVWLAKADNRRGTGEWTLERLEKEEASWQRDRDREADDADAALVDAAEFIKKKFFS